MKEEMSSLANYRELKSFLETASYTAISRVFAISATHSSLNNVNCVKNAIFENNFEQFSHFSTV